MPDLGAPVLASDPISVSTTYPDVLQARERIRDHVHQTPVAFSEELSERTGNRVWLKLENLQRTGSFKARGALNKLLSLKDAEREAGVICASAGNHAQGIAYGCQQLDIRATIVMPLPTPLIKVSACRAMGADVILHGLNYDEASEHAQALRAEHAYTFVHPFNDAHIIAGQGTVGLEILEQCPDVDCIVVPVGGGGLISGILLATKTGDAAGKSVRVFGVEPTVIPAMKKSLSAGKPVRLDGVRTLAEGLATRRVGDLTFAITSEHVDGIATVAEEEIASAILQLIEQEKTVVEGAGAAGLAALVNDHLPIQNKNVVLVLSGGNIDVTLLSRIIQQGLVKDGRMVQLVVRLADEPGALAGLTRMVADHRANVVSIGHERGFGSGLGQTDIILTLETKGFDHVKSLLESLESAGYELIEN